MGKIKNFLKKPTFAWGVNGALGLGISILALTNIGLKNQNDYLFNKYINTGKLYTDLVVKHVDLREDTLKNSIKHSFDILDLKRKNIKLAYSLDSLNENYANSLESLIKNYVKLDSEIDSLNLNNNIFAENFLNTSEENKNLFGILKLIVEEKDFYKQYAGYLDSLLFKCESEKSRF